MPIRMRQSSFRRLSTVCLAAAMVCWSFLLPPGDRKGVLMFLRHEDFKDPQVADVMFKLKRRWDELPDKTRKEFVKANFERMIRHFTFSVVSSMEAAAGCTFSSQSYWDLMAACEHALGPDIEIEMLGSRTRRTAAVQDTDMDFQVRRSRESGRRNDPFTDEDKEMVKQNLETLACVTGPVTNGNIAIKFEMENAIDVDLVLWKPRLEDFPNLRGGEDFCENSKRINKFLEQTPAARAAIIGVKQLMESHRPKGLLLEAIAMRLSETFWFPLTSTDPVYSEPEEEIWKLQAECYGFFQYFVKNLKHWRTSPFGSDLEKDLAMLPDSKQKEHIQRFDILREKNRDGYSMLLFADIFTTAQKKWAQKKWPHEDGPWHAFLEREFVEFFPFDEKRPSRRSKKRKKAAPIESGLLRAPRSRTEPRGFA